MVGSRAPFFAPATTLARAARFFSRIMPLVPGRARPFDGVHIGRCHYDGTGKEAQSPLTPGSVDATMSAAQLRHLGAGRRVER